MLLYRDFEYIGETQKLEEMASNLMRQGKSILTNL